jgi:hypothetical protein
VVSVPGDVVATDAKRASRAEDDCCDWSELVEEEWLPPPPPPPP